MSNWTERDQQMFELLRDGTGSQARKPTSPRRAAESANRESGLRKKAQKELPSQVSALDEPITAGIVSAGPAGA
jgi:hypothetical protein